MAKKIAIVVDYQYDFINPEGALYVKDAEKIFYGVGKTITHMDGVVFTVDWHPFEHCSFKANAVSGKYRHLHTRLWNPRNRESRLCVLRNRQRERTTSRWRIWTESSASRTSRINATMT